MPPSVWYEARMREGAHPMLIYAAIGNDEHVSTWHHFWDEPWWPDRYVVRLGVTEDNGLPEALRAVDGVAEVVPWDAGPDEEAYGKNWGWAAMFFHAGTGLNGDYHAKAKAVHCYLNSTGMGHWAEAWFALRFAWGRMTIGLRWRLYLRRRWMQEQQS